MWCIFVAAGLWLDEELKRIAASGRTPRLLLHCCCAPCASYVLEYLSPFFDITALFFNPNIEPFDEYEKRESELCRLIAEVFYPNPVRVDSLGYDNSAFASATERLSDEPEGGRRCEVCFNVRLGETAKLAAARGFDYFATTLSVSPHKNAELLNEVGRGLEQSAGVRYLQSDFKKRDGYKRSIELSKRFGLYRQSYCGCAPSQRAHGSAVRVV